MGGVPERIGLNKERKRSMKKSVTIHMSDNLEARPIAHLVQTANAFDSEVYLEVDQKRVNVKSIMGMMSLGLISGTEITIDANGADEAAAVDAIEKFLTERD